MFKPLMWTYPNMGALHSHDHQHHGHGELGGAGLVDTSWNLYCYWLSIELHLLQCQNLIISNHVHLLELSVSAGQQFINPKIIPANVSSNKHALIRLIEYRISILASWQSILFLSGRALLIIRNQHFWLNLGNVNGDFSKEKLGFSYFYVPNGL